MPQSVNIVYLLLSHLNRYLWMEIPGIGVFQAKKSATYIDHINKKIHPARLAVEFIPGETSRSEIMLQNIMDATAFEQQLLEEHLAALCQFITDSLKSASQFSFQPFGLLQKRNGELIFKQSDSNLHQDFYQMESLHLEPVIHTPGDSIISPVIPERKTRSTNSFLYLLLALALLWILCINLLFCPSPSQKKITPVDTTTNNITTAIPPDTIKKMDTLPALVDSIPTPDTISKVDTSSLNNEVPIDSSNIKELNDKIKYKPCIIIIGSFIKKSNADRLTKRVAKEGYKPYRGNYKQYYRVGIEFNCFEHDLQDMLGELKKKFHPASWVLKY